MGCLLFPHGCYPKHRFSVGYDLRIMNTMAGSAPPGLGVRGFGSRLKLLFQLFRRVIRNSNHIFWSEMIPLTFSRHLHFMNKASCQVVFKYPYAKVSTFERKAARLTKSFISSVSSQRCKQDLSTWQKFQHRVYWIHVFKQIRSRDYIICNEDIIEYKWSSETQGYARPFETQHLGIH